MQSPQSPRKRLESWKEIADHLRCTARTAQRYESRGMPVYRVGAREYQRVFAFADELDHWVREGESGLGPEDALERVPREASPILPEVDAKEAALQYLVLEITEGSEPGSSVSISRPSTVLGRDVGAGLLLADPRISRQHARIDRQGETFVIEDLQSRNGTTLNGKVLATPAPLSHGDEIRLAGAISLRVRLVYAGETVEAENREQER